MEEDTEEEELSPLDRLHLKHERVPRKGTVALDPSWKPPAPPMPPPAHLKGGKGKDKSKDKDNIEE